MEILSKTEGLVLFFQDPPQLAGPEEMAQMGIWEFLYQCQKWFFLLWEWLSRSTGCLGGYGVSILRDTQKPSGHEHLALIWAEVWTRWTLTVSASLRHLWFCQLLHHLNDREPSSWKHCRQAKTRLAAHSFHSLQHIQKPKKSRYFWPFHILKEKSILMSQRQKPSCYLVLT